MANANLVVLMGNLTRDPELRYTPSGTPVTTLNMAVNRRYRDNSTNEMIEKTDFIPVSVWRKQAENCEKYLSKGRGVYVQGRLNYRQWENQAGDPRSRLEVVASIVQFLPYGGRQTDVDQDYESEDEIDELPEEDTDEQENKEERSDEEIPF
ncbi:MAG: single-stranded DNA-binding protein [Elusimicrobiota bacterium]